MKNIAILTEEFIKWNGGRDFIEGIIKALDCVCVKNNIKLFIFVPAEATYKNIKGLKRICCKFIYKYIFKNTLCDENKIFSNLEKKNFVEYSPSSLKRALKEYKIDVILPVFRPNRLRINIPHFVYLYDCQHKYYPQFFSKREIYYRDKYFNKMVKKENKIIVNANSVKNDLIKFYNASPEKIYVLPFATILDNRLFEDNSSLIQKYNLPEKYFVISNQFWMHKDHKTALKAYAEFLNHTNQNIHLVCTGLMEEPRNQEYIKEVMQITEDLKIKDKVHFLGFIPKIEQIEIIKKAIAIIQPSLFEGGPGGGSIFDAVALGLNCIVSDISINKEIKSDKLTFFKAGDENDLTQKLIETCRQNFEPPKKETLIEKNNYNKNKMGNFLVKLIQDAMKSFGETE